MTSRSDWMLPGGSVFVKPLDRKAPGRSATQTMLDVEALNEFAPRVCPIVLLDLLSYLAVQPCYNFASASSTSKGAVLLALVLVAPLPTAVTAMHSAL